MGRAVRADPHALQKPVWAAVPLAEATKALILLHGRGGSPEGMLPLAQQLAAEAFAVIAPRAAAGQWYPRRFKAPLDQNQPYLSSALKMLEALVVTLNEAGIAHDKIVLGGFSQGACLAAEFVAQHPARYGGLLLFSGALIGEGTRVAQDLYQGDLAGTPVFIGCSDSDVHIPLERLKITSQILIALGATVDEHIYPAMGHTIVADELERARQIVSQVS